MKNDSFHLFHEWLCSVKGFSSKSARDVVSRVNRSKKYISESQDLNDEELLFRMGQNPEFKRLSRFVKSQLRRAIKLYREYERSSNKT